jgi:alternative ribosome-rescue factor
MRKKNLIAKDLRTVKYRPRVVKSKRGKGSFKRKKNNKKNLLIITKVRNSF